MALARLKCEPELLRVLHSDQTAARELGRRALEHIWFHRAGKDAYRLLEQAHEAMEKKEFQRALAILDRMIDQYPRVRRGVEPPRRGLLGIGQLPKIRGRLGTSARAQSKSLRRNARAWDLSIADGRCG